MATGREAEPSAGGVVAQRGQITLCMRTAGHVGMLLRTRTWRASAIALGGLGADLWLVRRLRRDDEPHRLTQLVTSTAAAAAWARFGVPTASPRLVPVAMGVPEAVEGGFRTAAGGEALPAVPGAPRSGGRLVAAVVRELAAGIGPALVTAAVRRHRGITPAWGVAGWSVFAFANGAGLGQLRKLHHRRLRGRWMTLNERGLAAARWSGRAYAARANTVGHSFKKVLLALGQAGDEEAQRLALHEAEHPSTLGDSPGGVELLAVCLVAGAWPEPEARRSLWLSAAQAAQLGRFLASVTADDPDDDVLEVREVHPDRLVVAFGGQLAILHERLARPGWGELRLDPVALAFVLGAAWKLSLMLPAMGRVKATTAVPGAALDLAAAAAILRRPPVDDRPSGFLLVGAGSNLAASALLWREPVRRQPDGGELIWPASIVFQSLAFLTGRYWPRLGRRERLGWCIWPLIQWLVTSRRQVRADRAAAIIELSWTLGSSLTILGFDERLDHETSLLARWMDAESHQRLADARLDGVNEELDRFRHALSVADAALFRLGSRLDERTAAVIADECRHLRDWLDDPRTPRWLAS